MMERRTVVDAAAKFYQQKDDVALEVLIGMRDRAIAQDASLKDDVEFEPKYSSGTMGPIDDVKVLGQRILNRWNKELYGLVCEKQGAASKDREAVLDSLKLGEAAVIAALVGCLLSLGLAPAIAAPVAPLIVRKFVWPAKDELCDAWGESLKVSG